MLNIQNITKQYPTGIYANTDISFRVDRGSIVALVGPNGSGKTTLLRQLLKVLTITSGSFDIDGQGHATHLLAYCPQFPAVYPGLSIKETVRAAALYTQGPIAEDKIDSVLKRLGLYEQRQQLAYTLSGGQSKLLALAATLIQDKDYLILDEVTSMIDIATKNLIWNILQEERDMGKAILLSSHDLLEVKRVSDRTVVLNEGKVVYDGNIMEMKTDFCHASFIYKDSEVALEAVSHLLLGQKKQGQRHSIITEDLSSMIKVLEILGGDEQIVALDLEYPEVYEGMLSLFSKGGKNV